MARLKTRTEESLDRHTVELLEPTRVNSKIADVYLQFANSEHSLAAYLQMEASVRQSALSDLEVEAIKLLVSEITGCEYCLSVHTMKSNRAGLDKGQQLAIRSGRSSGEERLDVILDIVRHFFAQRSPIPDELVEDAGRHGVSDETLIDIAMTVSAIFFTNITNHINDTKRTLPAAPPVT